MRTVYYNFFKLAFQNDIGYVYNEPSHSLLCKWLLLGDAEDSMSGAKGYLKVTINVLGPGDEIPYNLDPSMDDDIERLAFLLG